jgi:hypothetical protein
MRNRKGVTRNLEGDQQPSTGRSARGQYRNEMGSIAHTECGLRDGLSTQALVFSPCNCDCLNIDRAASSRRPGIPFRHLYDQLPGLPCK